MVTFVREKKIYCGADYLEVDIYPRTETQAPKNSRGKKTKISSPKQKNLNDKNAKRYFVQLAESNFVFDDLVVHLTYDKKFLPLTRKEAEKIVEKYLKRVRRLRKKKGLPPLKFMLVTHVSKKGRRQSSGERGRRQQI